MKNSRKKTISMVSEERFIENILAVLSEKAVGVGDDCAVLPFSSRRNLLVTTDMLVEGVDFDLSYCSFEDIGYKSVMANLSDIAAMGGEPVHLLFSVGIPEIYGQTHVKRFYIGVKEALGGCNAKVVGGDLSESEKWVVSVTAIGKAPQKNVKLRSGAKTGDKIFIVGNPGRSAVGLQVLQDRKNKKSRRAIPKILMPFVHDHLRPEAQIKAGKLLGSFSGVTSMMDISDGLSLDLSRVCTASSCGAVIYNKYLPVDNKLLTAAEKLKSDPYSWVLHGGEDFCLLFTCSKRSVNKMYDLMNRHDIHPIEIGKIKAETSGITLVDSDEKRRELPVNGFDHFCK